jgi:phage shock protein PspC (stress-responsive transcriptional regulator)
MKKLYKSSKNKMISGVCGGVAEYFSVDPTLIRIGMVILGFISGGTAAIAYLVCSIVMPSD